MAKRKKSARVDASYSDDGEALNNPFARLLGGDEEPAPAPPVAKKPLPTPKAPARKSGPPMPRRPQGPAGRSANKSAKPEPGTTPEAELDAKLVLRREKKGRGGKTVTRVSGVRAGPERLSARAKELAQALGTRAWVEDGELLLAGDQTAALENWLRKAGASKVVVGN